MASDNERTDLGFWFTGFFQGVNGLAAAQRDRMLQACARSCLARGTLGFYGELFERVDGDLDAFFRALDEVSGLAATVDRPGRAWTLSFLSCTCPLHTQGHVNTPALCACSRQGVSFALHELWAAERFTVELKGSIIAGDSRCAMAIERVSGV
ncbi:hypothetical protein [Collinsella tanakaei]|uniref:hypothetical protein n=1 Tax=Collinsella tanakaei TaxID=626935 RepID=UPI0025A47A1F|nr:hypothetical protein [Collinsella tanakaei]MDM8302003.1 hypothetical protein [Collinsella tanakaei]